MTNAQIRGKVRDALAVALGHPVSPTEDVTQANDPAWDSMKHMELMLLLEEAFHVSLEPDDFVEMTSLERCVERIAARLGDRGAAI